MEFLIILHDHMNILTTEKQLVKILSYLLFTSKVGLYYL